MFIYGLLIFFLIVIWDINLLILAIYISNNDNKILKEKYNYKIIPWALIGFQIFSLIDMFFLIFAIVNS